MSIRLRVGRHRAVLEIRKVSYINEKRPMSDAIFVLADEVEIPSLSELLGNLGWVAAAHFTLITIGQRRPSRRIRRVR